MSRKASGFKAWLVQRISAIYMGLYILYLLFHFSFDAPADYVQWRSWLADPVGSALMSLFFLALLVHAWVGVRDVIIDYVHPLGLRLVVLSSVALLLMGCGFLILRTLILVAL